MSSGQLNLRTVKLGDNADTSKNFLIQVPAVADGSLSVQTESGVPVLTRSAAGVITLGAGQIWQDVKASRALVTTYTNTTGQLIDVAITCTSNAVSGVFYITVAGLVIGYSSAASAVGAIVSGIFRVPAGASYSVTGSGGVLTITSWAELR